MTYLLDTHTLLWSALFSDLLSHRVRTLVEDTRNTLLISAASAFEIATKYRIGKLPEASLLVPQFEDVLSKLSVAVSPVTAAIALRAGRLAQEHRDPFDRIICATAMYENVALLSRDITLDTFGVRRIW